MLPAPLPFAPDTMHFVYAPEFLAAAGVPGPLDAGVDKAHNVLIFVDRLAPDSYLSGNS